MCLVCLLNEGIEAEPPQKGRLMRSRDLPCEFAGHRLVREIAGGAMGMVFEAEDLKLCRTVAMKVVRNAHFATREEAARFQAEVRAVARLDHPGIVPVYESGEEDGLPYFTMRLAEGGSLAERLISAGALPERAAAEMMCRIARAVQHAHDHGVLHRDLKPANILLDAQGMPMLSDFGLAKHEDSHVTLTASSAQLGTPHYMSPEQAAGRVKEITTLSDVWALGIILCQMLTGRVPFGGDSAVEILRRVVQEEPQIDSSTKGSSLVRAGLHRDLVTLVRRCLEKDPQRRLRSAGFLAEELERFLRGESIESRHVDVLERMWKLAVRHKAAAAAVLVMTFSLLGGTAVSLWQAVKAREAENAALKQKAESDEIADIVLDTVRGTDDYVAGHEVTIDELRAEMLKRVGGFRGDPRRKASMLVDLATMMTRPVDVEVFRVMLAELEPLLDADDPLLWDLRYRVTVKAMHVADVTEARRALDALRGILKWQREHLLPDSVAIYKTQFAIAEELIDEVEGKEACIEAEGLLRSCVDRYQRKGDAFDVLTCRIELMTGLFGQGKQDEALAYGRETCEMATKAFGDRHSITGRALGRLAKLCREAGQVEDSIVHGRHALDIYWRTVGPGYVRAVSSLEALADSLEKRKDHEALLRLRQDALRACDQRLGLLDPLTLRQAAEVVEALGRLNRSAEAHAIASQWADRARVDGKLPPAAAPLILADALLWKTDGQVEKVAALCAELLGQVRAQKFTESATFIQWHAVAKKLQSAGESETCAAILRHLIAALDKSDIGERKIGQFLPNYRELLLEAEAKRGSKTGV